MKRNTIIFLTITLLALSIISGCGSNNGADAPPTGVPINTRGPSTTSGNEQPDSDTQSSGKGDANISEPTTVPEPSAVPIQPEEIPEYITIRNERYSTALTELNFMGMNLENEEIEPLKYMVNLTYLHLAGNKISNLSSISGLTKLVDLQLANNQISDISLLSGLNNLTVLSLGNNQISDLSPLSGLTNLTALGLENNRISDLSPLSGLTKLAQLGLRSNRINDLSPLSGLADLWFLNVDSDNISDWSPVAHVSMLNGIWQ